jgi:hypothetical protein
MKLRLAMGLAAIFTLTIVPSAFSEPASARPCEEVTRSVKPTWLSSRYRSGEISFVTVRGASSCRLINGGAADCVVKDSGKLTVSTRTATKTFKAPRLSKVRILAQGQAISCRIVGA